MPAAPRSLPRILPDGVGRTGLVALVGGAVGQQAKRLAFRIVAEVRTMTEECLGRIAGSRAAKFAAALHEEALHLHGGRRRAGVAQQARLDVERGAGVDADAVPHAQHVLTLLAQHSGLHRAPKTLLQNRLVHGHDHLLSAQVDGLTWRTVNHILRILSICAQQKKPPEGGFA